METSRDLRPAMAHARALFPIHHSPFAIRHSPFAKEDRT
jgi:hypothetical protein